MAEDFSSPPRIGHHFASFGGDHDVERQTHLPVTYAEAQVDWPSVKIGLMESDMISKHSTFDFVAVILMMVQDALPHLTVLARLVTDRLLISSDIVCTSCHSVRTPATIVASRRHAVTGLRHAMTCTRLPPMAIPTLTITGDVT